MNSCISFIEKGERKLLRVFLLTNLQKLLIKLFHDLIQHDLSQNVNSTMEHYLMDSKIIQFLIRDIIKSGDYTLEGIAYHTRVPFDIIFDAACGNNNNLSITSWARIVDLYVQVKPEISKILVEQLLEMKERKLTPLTVLLNES